MIFEVFSSLNDSVILSLKWLLNGMGRNRGFNICIAVMDAEERNGLQRVARLTRSP